MNWDKRHLEGNVMPRDIVAAAKPWVRRMREEGADLAVALAHTGIGSDVHEEMMENAAIPLAAVEGLDAAATGHSHPDFPARGTRAWPGSTTPAARSPACPA